MTVQEYLKEKPLLFDGAMGTYLVEKHPETVKRNCEFMNIEPVSYTHLTLPTKA